MDRRAEREVSESKVKKKERPSMRVREGNRKGGKVEGRKGTSK